MASIVVAGDTSGTVTLTAPLVAGTTTLTLPTANGTLITTGSTGQVIPRAALPAGTVLQVVNATYSTQVDTTSGSYVDTGLTASITPSSSTSKILVLVSHQISISASTGYGNVQLLRGSTSVSVFAVNFIRQKNRSARKLESSKAFTGSDIFIFKRLVYSRIKHSRIGSRDLNSIVLT